MILSYSVSYNSLCFCLSVINTTYYIHTHNLCVFLLRHIHISEIHNWNKRRPSKASLFRFKYGFYSTVSFSRVRIHRWNILLLPRPASGGTITPKETGAIVQCLRLLGNATSLQLSSTVLSKMPNFSLHRTCKVFISEAKCPQESKVL